MTKKDIEKRKRKKSKKIFIMLLMILFTGVVLTASTYAWFTANQTVKVEAIDVNVATSNGLQVSVDATNWKTVISNDDINGASTTYTTSVNQLPASVIVPVSTIGEVDATGKMKMFVGEVTSNDAGEYILTAEQEVEARGTTGNFIAFDLFFQTNAPETIYLTSNSNVVALNTSTGVENAARIAFVDQGTVAVGSTVDAAQTLVDASATPIIWEPNYDVHTAAAVNNARDTYSINTSQTGGSLLPYNGVKADITAADNLPLNSTSANHFAAVTPTISTTVAGIPTTAYQKLMDVEAGVTKVRIYMWIEGQDVDCENNASGGSLSYNLQFSTLDKA